MSSLLLLEIYQIFSLIYFLFFFCSFFSFFHFRMLRTYLTDNRHRFMDNNNTYNSNHRIRDYNLPDLNDHHSNANRIIAKQLAKKTIKVYERSFDFH